MPATDAVIPTTEPARLRESAGPSRFSSPKTRWGSQRRTYRRAAGYLDKILLSTRRQWGSVEVTTLGESALGGGRHSYARSAFSTSQGSGHLFSGWTPSQAGWPQ